MPEKMKSRNKTTGDKTTVSNYRNKAGGMKFSIFILGNRIDNNVVAKRLRAVLLYYPLTLSGSLLLILSLILLGRSYAKSNPYGILLSIFALIMLIALSIAGRMQAAKLKYNQPPWESSQALFAESEKTYQLFHADRIKTLFFY